MCQESKKPKMRPSPGIPTVPVELGYANPLAQFQLQKRMTSSYITSQSQMAIILTFRAGEKEGLFIAVL